MEVSLYEHWAYCELCGGSQPVYQYITSALIVRSHKIEIIQFIQAYICSDIRKIVVSFCAGEDRLEILSEIRCVRALI